MKINSINRFIEKTWEETCIPTLMDYIRIPAVSPGFDPDWRNSGFLLKSLKLVETWCRKMSLDRSSVRIISLEDRTPVLILEVDASDPERKDVTLLYGHLDKQPPARGWDPDKGPWSPVIENGKLYGRGSADDGYAVFLAVTAIKALQTSGIGHGRCVILIETCEESGSLDLEYYLGALKDTIGTPDLVICLDSSGADYESLWITTSLRGSIAGHLEASILTRSVHSGNSGMVASSFRILRQVLDRLEDSGTGALLIPELYCPIPEKRLEQIRETATTLKGNLINGIPLVPGALPVSTDPFELTLNRTWKPALSVIGAQGLPPSDRAANVIRESTSLLLSIRTPPNVDTALAADKIKTILEKDPPYGASIKFHLVKANRGWETPDMGGALETKLKQASEDTFGKPPCYMGEGGSIPFMTLLAKKFPRAKFLVTGVLGPDSNAHGPNEFLHLDYVKKLTRSVSLLMGSF